MAYSTNKRTSASKQPCLIAYAVTNKTDDQSFWTRIGAAWDHEDGKGLNLQLDLMPVNGAKIVLREPKKDDF
jgi:hypothetical protein